MLALFYQMKVNKHKKRLEIEDYYKECQNKPKLLSKCDKNSKCRVCLEIGTMFIYDQNNSDEIIDILRLFDINMNQDDEYPKCLCNMCFDFIKGAVAFRNTARNSDKILRHPLKEEDKVFEPDFSRSNDFSDDESFDKETDKWNAEGNIEQQKVEKKEKIKYNSKVTCHICNKVINKSYYKEHITMHDPDHKKYVCDICGKSFRLRCAYHNHSLRHRTDFPYKCQFCPYKGRYAELLKTHMRTHTGDYRYMCTECPARFLFKSNLNSHMLKHKEPQYKCDSCKRAFHTKLMLQRHYEADHLGIKNHVCNICGKAFGYRNAMMKHQRHVHKREKLLFGRMPAYLQAEHSNQ